MKVLIAGGGIGGLATALSLHAVGVECEVFEQWTTIRELGVGINVLPHAVKELAGLGLLDALDRIAVRTSELAYTNRFGQQIWREPRGLELGVLCEAVRARIGDDHVHAAHQLRHFEGEARPLPHRPPDGDARYQPAELGGGGQARRECRAAAPA